MTLGFINFSLQMQGRTKEQLTGALYTFFSEVAEDLRLFNKQEERERVYTHFAEQILKGGVAELSLYSILDKYSEEMEVKINPGLKFIKLDLAFNHVNATEFVWNWLKKQPISSYGAKPDCDGSCYADCFIIKSHFTSSKISIVPAWSEYHK